MGRYKEWTGVEERRRLKSGMSKEKLERRKVSQVVLEVKNWPAMQETLDTWVLSLGQEDPLEKESHSTIFAWRIPWTRILKGYVP